ncbi:MAG: hypothetical protein HY923_00340 [Elusimicrobia bacterium]|nr:hypothetical protein [Elusimicrobiota bacterium]
MLIPALLLALSSPSHAAFEPFAVEIVHILPTPQELADAMRTGTREDRLAAVNRAAGLLGGFDSAGQRIVVWSLREQAESSSAPGEVRGRAFLVLGEQVGWLKDDMTKRDAIETLLGALEATPGDSREGYRRHALKGLWAAADRLPQDARLEDRVGSALTVLVSSSDGVERTMALLGLNDLLRSRPSVLELHRPTRGALVSALLDPIASSPSAFCTDGRRNDDERQAALRVLADIAWASADASARMRVRDIMVSVAQLDSNPAVRRYADYWSRAIRG